MIHLGQFGPTQVLSVSDSAPAVDDRFTSDISALSDVAIRRYLLTAVGATVYIDRNVDATTASAMLVANLPYEVELAGSDVVFYNCIIGKPIAKAGPL